MKKIILLLFIFGFKFSTAQQTEKVTYFNDDGKEVKEKKSSILIQKIKINDTLWEFNAYNTFGPLLVSVQTKDERGLIRNGTYRHYNNGYVDTVCMYRNNQKDSVKLNKGSKSKLDSMRSTNFQKVEIESSFIGGDKGWQTYLFKNFRYPDRAINNNIQGTVIVKFIVSKEGKVEDAAIEKSVEYSLDKETLRIINGSSDNWVSAVQNGRNVKSYKRQPIVFKLQIQK
jgi:periplasmic protein TonB